MLVLFDHCTPQGIIRYLVGHTVKTARRLGWAKLHNGELLKAAEDAGFDVMVSASCSSPPYAGMQDLFQDSDRYLYRPGRPPFGTAGSQSNSAALAQTDALGASASLDYPFLHEGILRAILCKVGEKAGESAVYWDWGLCVYDLERQSTVRIRTELADPTRTDAAGRIIVEATGGQSESLVSHLVESILKIKIGTKPEIHWALGGATSSSQVTPKNKGG